MELEVKNLLLKYKTRLIALNNARKGYVEGTVGYHHLSSQISVLKEIVDDLTLVVLHQEIKDQIEKGE